MNSQKMAATETDTPIVEENAVLKKPMPFSLALAVCAKSNPKTIVRIDTNKT